MQEKCAKPLKKHCSSDLANLGKIIVVEGFIIKNLFRNRPSKNLQVKGWYLCPGLGLCIGMWATKSARILTTINQWIELLFWCQKQVSSVYIVISASMYVVSFQRRSCSHSQRILTYSPYIKLKFTWSEAPTLYLGLSIFVVNIIWLVFI